MNKKTILEVQNFSISYRFPSEQALSLRDGFVNLFKKPQELFFDRNDMLLVLDNVSFEVNRGDIIGIIGGNGVGKTSLCRYLAGIIDSKNIKSFGVVRAIFDTNLSLYPNLSGYDNAEIIAGLMYSELNKSERREIVREALEFSELNDFVHLPLNRYSKGMKSRLYLSLVTSRPTDLIILDEIFGATDIFFSEKLSIRMKDMINKSGAAIIVSHNMDDIRLYCNKLMFITNKKTNCFDNIENGISLYEGSCSSK